MNDSKKLDLYRIGVLRKRIEFLKNNPHLECHGAFGFSVEKELKRQEDNLWQKIYQFESMYGEHPFLKKGRNYDKLKK